MEHEWWVVPTDYVEYERVLATFLSLQWNTWDAQRERLGFGSQFERIQSIICWPCCFGPVVGDTSQEEPWQSKVTPFKGEEEGRGWSPTFPIECVPHHHLWKFPQL